MDIFTFHSDEALGWLVKIFAALVAAGFVKGVPMGWRFYREQKDIKVMTTRGTVMKVLASMLLGTLALLVVNDLVLLSLIKFL